MRRSALWLAIALGTAWASCAAQAEDEHTVTYEFQVFRLSGEFRSQTSLDQGVWKGSDEQLQELGRAVTLFDEGEFRWRNGQLKISEQGCYWNDLRVTFEKGQEVDFPEQIKLIHSPTIRKEVGKRIRLTIDSKTPLQFMRRRDDGLFELKETALPVGLDIWARATDEGGGALRLDDLDIKLRTVVKRERLEGVSLRVGKPVLRELDYHLEFVARERVGYGVLLRPKGSLGAMVVRIAVSD